MMSGQREDRPREAPWRCEAYGSTLQIFAARLYNGFLCSIAQCKERNRGIVSVRRKGFSIDNSIACIPSTSRTGTIQKHLNPAIDAQRNALQATASTRELL